MSPNQDALLYLDQNILGYLLPNAPERERLRSTLRDLKDRGACFAVSEIHIEECRNHPKPELFISVFEELVAFFIPPFLGHNQQIVLSTGKVEDRLISTPSLAEQSQKFLDQLLSPIQFVSGFLNEFELNVLREAYLEALETWLEQLERETFGIADIDATRHQMIAHFDELDLNAQREKGKNCLPQSAKDRMRWWSEIDKCPHNQKAEFIFDRLKQKCGEDLLERFPKGKWLQEPYLTFGSVSSLAFTLFLHGVGRDKKSRSGAFDQRLRRFFSQYRDCAHIEYASKCSGFLTNDKGAFELAAATYAHAGVQTLPYRLTI